MNLKIRFSPPSVFNDPFDGISDAKSLMEKPQWFEPIIDSIVNKEAAEEAVNAAIQGI